MFNKPITILMAGVFGALVIALSSAGQTASMLKSGPTVQLPQAAIWGGISWNGSSLSITTTHNLTRSHLFLHRLDRELNSIAAPVQLTFDSDTATAVWHWPTKATVRWASV